jgi:hypothetical protein
MTLQSKIKSLSSSISFWVVFACLGIVILLECLLNLTPPISRDGLIHHLAIPKLWLKHGGFYETPWADFSYYPMNINLLYTLCLYFKNDILPKFIHMAFGWGTGLLIYWYLKARYGRNWGLLGCLVFISTPIVIWLSTSEYIDLGMGFFTTASVLGLVKWRDSEYLELKWLVVSACAMGLALGSKYNAMLAWFIVNLLVLVMYVRDMDDQKRSIQYGLIFFAISAAVASPWYIKNFVLTGNPFHPLFNSFFQSLALEVNPVQAVIQKEIIEKSDSVNFFQLRHTLYKESFWETLFIPVRMFFQGDDNSYQYFQGKLNPVLILFFPFAFLGRTHRTENKFFAAFSVLFMAMAFFLTAKQVRYLLPVFPFLSILAVAGIFHIAEVFGKENFFNKNGNRKNLRLILSSALWVSVALLLWPNITYLKERFELIKPLPYITGRESRDDFLKRLLPHYETDLYVNTNLPEDARIFTILYGRRGYYFDREYRNEPNFGTATLGEWVKQSRDVKKFKEAVDSMNITHVVMRTDLTDQYLRTNFPEADIRRFMQIVNSQWKLIYKKNNFAVWDVDKSS